MKYWVYKESRILGPFDKEAVSGLQGLDSGTLVCAGDPDGGSWVPAGELAGLTGIASGGVGGLLDDLPSSVGLLDQLLIDSAGLIGDDELSGSFAEELFQDASLKKGFGDVLSARAPSDDDEARRAREKIAELTSQLETMHHHISELEIGQTNLARRLVAKDLELHSRGDAAAVPGLSLDEAEVRRAREKIVELRSQLEVKHRYISELEAGQSDLARRLAAKDIELRSRGDAIMPVAPVVPAVFAPGLPLEEAEARRVREKIAELEAGQSDLARRLAAKDLEFRMRDYDVPPVAPTAPIAPYDVPPVAPAAPIAPFAPVDPAAFAPGLPSDEAEARRAREKSAELTFQLDTMYRHISEATYRHIAELEAGQSDLAHRLAAKDLELRLRGDAVAPAAPVAPAPANAVAVEPATMPLPALPDIPSFVSAAPVVPAPKTLSFGKPKSFKIVPTIRSFKVLGPDEAVPDVSLNPIPEFKFNPITETPEPVAAPVVPAEVVLTPAPSWEEPVPMPEPAPVTNPFILPPNTLSRSQPVPDLNSGDFIGSFPTESGKSTFDRAIDEGMPLPQYVGPAASSDSAGGSSDATTDDAVAARFAKPEPVPPTGEIRKPGRNNRAFLIGGGVLVALLVIVGVLFMRQPKEDLKQMATLDDGKAPIGLPADDGPVAPPPIIKPKIAETPPAAPPGPAAAHAAAIELVKGFPLDGGRGTVGSWLQYSYTADPNAGSEEWNASSTGDNTMLVEYRLVPGASGGKSALYLFEAFANGLVMGKTIEARQMLAGGPPRQAPKAKKPAKKAASQRRAVRKAPG